ncbi:Acetyltransferase (GNAT) family protein [Pseudovibrio axinellae]|uniref:Acetyltransferase (GNAT) family protein n=1 Tax=Pseudovibrio axinellae TaxID=989403 RepID=A0A165XTD9_9HYPH|nr:N-acetyltransferase [Pseudovibrio axinellae]KZL18020.1 Acetyltransferase (GNAT) family protein [Pseudovibrio axinellae]SER13262.1 Predicted N-acetyltransferase YhbS [Pseudovibrio axinellae]
MVVSKWLVRQEAPADFFQIEQMQAEAFGPARFTRTAFQIRDGVQQEMSLCFVGEQNGEIAGSIKLTPIMIGNSPSMLLGPLTVKAAFNGQGLGRLLLETVAKEAKAQGVQSILLVGDHPYYGPHGYQQITRGTITLPGPVDPDRLLILMVGAGTVPQGAVVGGHFKPALVVSKPLEGQAPEFGLNSFAMAT